MGHEIIFSRPDGQSGRGYYAEPAPGPIAPGVVVIQEWWGLNDQIKGVAERLAQSGYRALVPDLYRGRVTLDAAEAEHLMNDLDFGDAATQDIRGAVCHLKSEGAKVGVVGFCMGGVLAILAAIHAPEADAASSWYGVPPAEAGDVSRIRIPLQGHFAELDEFFPVAQVDALEARLRAANVAMSFYRYPARHAFGNETGPNYDPNAAQLAWQRTLDFFQISLRA
jgi:carboxymethylenebutenolidase